MLKLIQKTTEREQFIDITQKLDEFIKLQNFRDGMMQIFIPHTTAGVTINECADQTVRYDVLNALKGLIPCEAGYKHMEGNSDAHIKTLLTGVNCLVPVENGNLCLGRWQGIFFCEYDGPRNREIWIKLLGDSPK